MKGMQWDSSTFEELAASREPDVVVPAPDRAPIRVPIWVVAVDGGIYVRSWKGEAGRWYRRARRYGSGSLATSAGERAVRFVPVDDAELDAAIDREYLVKYGRNRYARAMIRPPATGTTLRLDPAD